jgi:hypothetical protein
MVRPGDRHGDGGIVLRKLSLLAFSGLLVIPLAAVRAQDQPQSLGEVARQNRKEKEKNPTTAKTVLTDDNFGSSSRSGGSGSAQAAGAGSGAAAIGNLTAPSGPSRTANGDDSPMAKAWDGIGRAQDSLERLAPLDRATLAKVVLEGNDVNFPNRRAWEDRLFAAKERYVAHSRQLLGEMKDLLQNTQAMRDANGGAKVATENAQAQQLMARAQVLLGDAQNTEAEFKTVMDEGVAQAKQASPRP